MSIDAASPKQAIEGFGATWGMEYFSGPTPTDVLTASQRARVLDAQFNKVKIRLGQSLPLYEAPQSAGSNFFNSRANDNSDPKVLDWSGFNTWTVDNFKNKIIDPAPAGTANLIYPGILLNSSYASPWLAPFTSDRKQTVLDECAEKTLAMVTYWTNTFGSEPRFAHLANEGFSGNFELGNMPSAWAPDLVRTCGRRLRDAGFKTVKFVYPNEEREDYSLNVATLVLADAEARSYIGAIGFHPYPYGSTYSTVSGILNSSGAGNPEAGKVQVRNQLRDLAAPYGIEVWMTEVSNGYYGQSTSYSTATGLDGLRARAIHIHDEFVYADASAWFGMNSSWSRTSTQLHNPAIGFYTQAESLVLTDQNTDEVFITFTGYAIGHYARWIAPRSRRLTCTSGDPLVQTTAFRDKETGRLVLVAINNASSAKTVAISLSGATIGGSAQGEQSTGSTAATYWQPLSTLTVPDGSTALSLTLPALSVTSLAVPFSTPPANQAPAVNAGTDQTILSTGTATLHGVSTDDGLPSDTLTFNWSKESGTGNVVFTAPTYLDTTASFSEGGTYMLKLSAFDGELTMSSTLTVTVAKSTATVILGSLAQNYAGTPISASATTTPPNLNVTFTYNGSSTPPTNAGSYTVVATINDPNYQDSASGTLVISKAIPAITWTNPTEISYGTALSGAQLNATANPPGGAFAYNPASGTMLNASNNQSLSLTYTPLDTGNYNNANASVTINVLKATATVNLSGLSPTYDGAVKAVSASTTPPGLNVGITYDGSSTPPTNAGSYSVIATINDQNYQGSASATLIINNTLIFVVDTANDSAVDSDSDGFSDAFESAAGTDPASAASTPFDNNGHATAPAVPPAPETLSIKLNFIKILSDSIQLKGALPLKTSDLPLTEKKVVVDIGGYVTHFVLGANGKSPKSKTANFAVVPKPKNGVSKFSCKIAKSTLAGFFADEGMTKTANPDTPADVLVTVLLNNAGYQATVYLLFTQSRGTSGKTKPGH